jgi:hypothetical protein
MSRIITDYYQFRQFPESKSKYRIDCVESTNSYMPFEILRNKKGELFFYFSKVPNNFSKKAKLNAEMSISKTNNISSVFVPDVSLPFAYGDNRNTTDAILIIFSDNNKTIELFICRGQKFNQRQLYFMLVDGELHEDILMLKSNTNQ